MNTKKCGHCQQSKSFECFNKCKTGTYGLHGHCKDCQKQIRREWYLRNKEQEIKKASEYARTDKAISARKKSYKNNKEKILENNRIRRRTPHARKLANSARNKMYHNNISFRISVNLRNRIRRSLKGILKSKNTLTLIGCTLVQLRTYLESKFADGMSWDNYGYYGWHIDHIKPCSSFDLSQPTEQAKCFHYSNLQPLWMNDNISKGG